MKRLLLASLLTLGATSAGLAQSQTGGNFGTPYSGTAAARSGGHYYAHARYRNSGGQSAHDDEGGGGGGGGREIDASDSNAPSLAAATHARH